jgi:hypothetical protein
MDGRQVVGPLDFIRDQISIPGTHRRCIERETEALLAATHLLLRWRAFRAKAICDAMTAANWRSSELSPTVERLLLCQRRFGSPCQAAQRRLRHGTRISLAPAQPVLVRVSR